MVRAERAEGAVFEELLFPEGPLRDFKVVQFQKTLESGTVCPGLGCSTNLAKASRQAVYEYYERKAFLEIGVNSGFSSTNGVALHKFRHLAVRAASAELFERDAFLYHWYTKRPFRAIPAADLEDLGPYRRHLRELGYETLVVEANEGYLSTMVTFLISRASSGFVVGTSAGRRRKDDILKSFVEACINLFFGDYGRSESELRSDLQSHGVRGLSGHRAFWLYEGNIPSWTVGGSDSGKSLSLKSDLKLEVVPFAMEPFCVVGVRHPLVLPLRIGLPNTEDLEILRARQRLLDIDGELSLESLWPHPIC